MKIISKNGDPRHAEVYVAQVREDPRTLIEFVDAVDPRFPRAEKWVIIVSTQLGCPVGCEMCDSGAYFYGNLTKDEIFKQIDHILTNHQSPITDHCLYNHPKLKIQFARMGEPSLNPVVLDVLEELPIKYPIDGLLPCITTTAPVEASNWFERLADVKDKHFADGRFQLQFSINSTSETERDKMMPIKKWTLPKISTYGEKFYKDGDRKITLNFAWTQKAELNPYVLKDFFDPKRFLVKITPVNPTDNARQNKINTVVSPSNPYAADEVAEILVKLGFETIISIGSAEELKIGSNCGQSTRKYVEKISNITELSLIA